MTMGGSRAVLRLAIRGYRRWLSGKGPLRRVRCTFHHGETCSAFGLRAAHEAPDLRTALGRIRRRVRRCGEASIFALPVPDGGRALGWGADHERPLAEVLAELAADGELPAARATVLAARGTVARWRGDVVDLIALAPHRHGLPAVQVLVRRPPPWRLVAGLLAGRAAAAAVLVVAAALVAPALAAALGTLAALGLGGTLRGHLARRARLRAQARAATLRQGWAGAAAASAPST